MFNSNAKRYTLSDISRLNTALLDTAILALVLCPVCPKIQKGGDSYGHREENVGPEGGGSAAAWSSRTGYGYYPGGCSAPNLGNQASGERAERHSYQLSESAPGVERHSNVSQDSAGSLPSQISQTLARASLEASAGYCAGTQEGGLSLTTAAALVAQKEKNDD